MALIRKSASLLPWAFFAAIVTVFALGTYAAATSPPEKQLKCPPGWKPNTGYLQRGCTPR